MSTRLSAVPVLCLALLGLVPVACGESTAPSPSGTNTPPVAGDLPPSPTEDPTRPPDVNLPSIPPTVTTSEDPKDYPKLKIEVLREAAEGAVLEMGKVAKVHYTGTQRNGREFDSSWRRGTEPAQFDLGGVVKGFRLGLLGMHVGERRRITVPGDLAYGPGGNAGAGIGPNETLIFDVELLGVDSPGGVNPTGR